MKRWFAFVAMCLLLNALSACDGDAGSAPNDVPLTGLQTIELRHNGGVLRVELAVTPAERARGLAGRALLAEDAGMLFVLGSETIPSFWMKGTLIPLDMIWVGADKRVAGIAANVQPEPGVKDSDLRRYSPDTLVAYVLELNGGAAALLGIEPGEQLTFEAPDGG